MEITRIIAEIKKKGRMQKLSFCRMRCIQSRAVSCQVLFGREGENAQSQPLHSK